MQMLRSLTPMPITDRSYAEVSSGSKRQDTRCESGVSVSVVDPVGGCKKNCSDKHPVRQFIKVAYSVKFLPRHIEPQVYGKAVGLPIGHAGQRQQNGHA